MSRAALVVSLVVATTVVLGACTNDANAPAPDETSTEVPTPTPTATPTPTREEVIEAAHALYERDRNDYRLHMQEYDPVGDYLNYSTFNNYVENSRIKFDEDGLPMVEYDGVHHYNPTTIAQFALTMHGHYLAGTEPIEPFLTAVDFLVEWQEPSGALPYPFPYEAYVSDQVFEPGWVSAMAQGQALSAFARAYDLTGDERYLRAGELSMELLGVPKSEGGTMTTYVDLGEEYADLLFFREYPNDPDIYTLNGFMFTILGFLDWSEVVSPEESASSTVARDYFDRSMETLVEVLPLYDVGGFTAYDLGFMIHDIKPNLQPWYHSVHIGILHVLHTKTGIEELKEYEELWASYVRLPEEMPTPESDAQ